MTDNFTPEKNTGAPKMSLEEWKAMKDQEKSDIFKLLDQTTLDLIQSNCTSICVKNGGAFLLHAMSLR